MKKLILALAFIIMACSVSAVQLTVCSAGCNYTDITSGLIAVNDTTDTLSINESGSYSITTLDLYNINDSTNAGVISIDAQDVLLNCNGSTIYGENTGYGIYSTYANTTLIDCLVDQFTIGVHLLGASDSTIDNLSVQSCTYGLRLASTNDSIVRDTSIVLSATTALHLNGAHNNSLYDLNMSVSTLDISGAGTGTINYVYNSTFDDGKLSFTENSLVFKYWDAQVRVTDSNGLNVSAATVNLTDNANSLASSEISDVNGITNATTIPEYYANGSGVFYYTNYSILAYNNSHYVNWSANISNTGVYVVVIDVTAPALLSQSNTTTNQSVLLNFTTDDMANATLEWGDNTTLLNSNTSTAFTSSKVFNLNGLINSTTYYYNITLCNANGLCSENGVFNVTTNSTQDLSAPTISNRLNTSTNETCDITFDTNEAANATISYGVGPTLDMNSSLSTAHIHNLTGLSNNTQYLYNITVCDSFGNCAVYGQYNFTTNVTAPPTTFYCDNCSNCNTQIGSMSSGDTLIMTSNMSTTGDCINLPGGIGITVDCDGYTLSGDQGFSDYAFYDVIGSNHVIRNCRTTGFGYGVYLAQVNDSVIENIYTENNSGYGIRIYGHNNTIKDSVIVKYPTNAITEGGIHLQDYDYETTTKNNVSNVTVNGRLVMYYDNVVSPCPDNQDISFTNNYSTLIFDKCSNVTVYDTTLTDGLYLYYTDNSTFDNITISDSDYAVTIYESHRNTFRNITAFNNSGGIYCEWNCTYSSFTDLSFYNHTLYGIEFSAYGDYNNLTRINCTNTLDCIWFDSDYCRISDVKSINDRENGIDLWGDYNTFENVYISGADDSGLFLYSVKNSTFINFTIENSVIGLESFGSTSNNTLINFTITNSSDAGIHLRPDNQINNIIYNSYFNNTLNLRSLNETNTWSLNTSLTTATNAIGGSSIGGNFWATPTGTGYSENCTDSVAPFGICDNYYNLSNATTSVIDYLPLVYDDTTAPIQSLPSNTTANSSVLISWSTDDSANFSLEYGTSATVMPNSSTNSTLDTTHAINITGLISNTTYYLNITSCNAVSLCTESGPHHITTEANAVIWTNYTITVYVNDSNSDIQNAEITFKNRLSSTVDTGVTDASGLYAANISAVMNNGSGLTYFSNFTIKVAGATYIGQIRSVNITANKTYNFTLLNQTGTVPNATTYENNESTDFDLIPDLENASNVTIGTTDGNINFPGAENFSGADLDNYINITTGVISLDAVNLPQLNTSAMLTMKNILCPVTEIFYINNFTTNSYSIFINGSDCVLSGKCTIVSCTGTTLKFNVTGFSSFAPGVSANLTIWDDTDTLTKNPDEQIEFYANYSSTGPINTSSANCNVSFNITGNYTTAVNMSYNATSMNYEYNRSVNASGNYSFRVYCDAVGYDGLNTTDNFDVTATSDSTPANITVNEPTNASTIANGTTQVLLNITTTETAECQVGPNATFNYSTGTTFTVTDAANHLHNYTTTAGAYNLYYKCNDTSGNVNPASKYHTFTINATPDNSEPVITLSYPSNASMLSYASTWTWMNITTNENATCEYSNIAGFNYSNGTAFTTTGAQIHAQNYTVANGTNYSIYYRCNDTAGNVNSNTTHHFFGVNSAPPDVTPPSITNVANSSITNISAVITWTTNESSNSTVKYGTSSGTYSTTATGAAMVTSHSVTLSSLLPTTAYFYVVNSSDASGNSVQSSESTFNTTDLSPPVISSVASSSITGTGATITWTTGESGNSKVEYGTVSGLYTASAYSATMTTSHSVPISGLTPDTLYYYRVISNDTYANSGISAQTSFTTLDTAAPVITFTTPINMSTTITAVGPVTLTVTTSEAATCYVSAYKLGSSVTTGTYVLTASGGNLSHTRAFTATAESSGYNFYFTTNCYDSGPNVRSKTVYFALDDTVAPTATFVDPSPADDGYTSNTSVTFKISASETQASGYPVISVNGGTAATMSASGSYYQYTATLSEAEHNYTITVRDAYSNSRSYSRTVTVDVTEPDLDETWPEDDDEITSCSGVLFNVSLDEPGNCTFTLYEDLEDDYDDCVDECGADHTDCRDDAEDADDREECDDDEDGCEEDCEEDRYDKIEDDDMEPVLNKEDCLEDCEEGFDDCEKTCDDEKDDCYDDADDNDDKDDCDDDEDDCVDDCTEDETDCDEDCDAAEGMLNFNLTDTCYPNGVYLVTFECNDVAGNMVEENVSFTINDVTAPKITKSEPDGKVKKTTAELEATTDENAKCKFAETDVSYANMNLTMDGTSKTHTYDLKNLVNQKYTYYVRCNDSNGNVMTTSEVIEFTVDSADAPTAATTTFDVIATGETASFIITNVDIAIIGISITVNSEVDDVDLEVQSITDTSNIKKPNDPVFQYVQITKSGISNKQIDKVMIEFRVPSSWITDQGIKAEDVSLFKYTTQWEEASTKKLSEDGQYAYYEAETTGFSVFAIMGKTVATTSTTTTPTTTTPDDTTDSTDAVEEDPVVEEPTVIDDSSSSWTWIIILCVMVVGGGAAGFYVYKSHRHPQQDSFAEPHIQPTQTVEAEQPSSERAQPSTVTPPDELSIYVNECLNQGMGLDQVRHALLDAGYPDDDVNSKFADMGLIDELGDYINQARTAGQNADEIRTALVEAGFDPNDVDSKLVEMGIASNELEEYVNEALRAGMGNVEIKEQLLNAGYTEQDIDPMLPGQASHDDDDRQVLDYITASIQYGMAPIQVKQQLIAEGFHPDYADAMVKHVTGKPVEPEQQESVAEVQQEPVAEEAPLEPVPEEVPQEPVAEVQAEPAQIPQAEETESDDIMDYIKKGLDDKVSRAVITGALVKAGHTKKEIKKRFTEIDAVKKKLIKDLKLYVKTEKKAGKKKKEIRAALTDQGIDKKTIRKVL